MQLSNDFFMAAVRTLFCPQVDYWNDFIIHMRKAENPIFFQRYALAFNFIVKWVTYFFMGYLAGQFFPLDIWKDIGLWGVFVGAIFLILWTYFPLPRPKWERYSARIALMVGMFGYGASVHTDSLSWLILLIPAYFGFLLNSMVLEGIQLARQKTLTEDTKNPLKK